MPIQGLRRRIRRDSNCAKRGDKENMTVEAVVFDIGNVLLEWHPEHYFDRTIGPERRKAMFAAVICAQ